MPFHWHFWNKKIALSSMSEHYNQEISGTFFLFEAVCLDQGSAKLFIEGQVGSILDFVVRSAVVGTTQVYSCTGKAARGNYMNEHDDSALKKLIF